MSSGQYFSDSDVANKSSSDGNNKGQYVHNYEFIVSMQQKAFGVVVEKHRLKSILNDYDAYQKVSTSWHLPFGLFVSCVIGILGSKLAWEVNSMLVAQVTGFLYATTLGLLIWTGWTGWIAYQSSKSEKSIKDADNLFERLSCHDNFNE